MTSTVLVSDASSLPERSSGERYGERVEPHELSDGVDRRLLRRCSQGDPAALREIVARYQPRLYRFLGPLLESPEDAEEVALDVFLRVWQQAHRFEGRASVATWLYRIAANAARDRLRRRQGQARVAALAESQAAEDVNAEETALNRMEGEETSRRLRQALHALRPEDRLLLVLYYQEELGYAEIGQITHLPAPVLKMRLLRARRRLRPLLEALAPQEAETLGGADELPQF